MTQESTHHERDRREREAARWCARMHGDEATSLRAEFDEWLKSDPRNLEAYNQVEEVYLIAGAVARRRTDASEAAKPAPHGGSRNKRTFGVALAGAVAGLLILGVDRMPWPVGSPAKDVAAPDARSQDRTFRTADTRPEQIALDDGSVVMLAAASELTVAFDARQRMLTLTRGSARFEVAHEKRPFTVSAGGGTVTARGTIFAVRYRDNRKVEVDLVRGAVDVMLPMEGREPHGIRDVRRLRPGERVTFYQQAAARSDENHARSEIAAIENEADRALTVGELVAKANAAYPTEPRLVVEDDDVLRSDIGGTFKLRDPATLAEWLGTMFGMRIDRSMRDRIVLRR